MASFTVVYDACVLYSASVRDLVVELALTAPLRAKWTARIHEEWINAVTRDRPELGRARFERVARLMNSAIQDSLVTEFESIEAGLTSLPDPNDRHVVTDTSKLVEVLFSPVQARAPRSTVWRRRPSTLAEFSSPSPPRRFCHHFASVRNGPSFISSAQEASTVPAVATNFATIPSTQGDPVPCVPLLSNTV
jgi:hypothetical protein